jgi:hypothetical protein
MREPWALTASTAAFAASWRDSNYTVRANDHRNRRTIKMRTVAIGIEASLKFIIPITVASDLASRARMALASSSAA